MTKPEMQEIINYFETNGSSLVEAQKFFFYYESVGWIVGKGKAMKSWKGCAGGWILRQGTFNKKDNADKFSDENRRARMGRFFKGFGGSMQGTGEA